MRRHLVTECRGLGFEPHARDHRRRSACMCSCHARTREFLFTDVRVNAKHFKLFGVDAGDVHCTDALRDWRVAAPKRKITWLVRRLSWQEHSTRITSSNRSPTNRPASKRCQCLIRHELSCYRDYPLVKRIGQLLLPACWFNLLTGAQTCPLIWSPVGQLLSWIPSRKTWHCVPFTFVI